MNNKGLISAATLLPLAISLATPQFTAPKAASPVTVSSSSGACEADLASCPDIGCAQAGSSHALVNQIKRTFPSGTEAKLLDFSDFQGLQLQADSKVGQKVDLDQAARSKLHNLSSKAGPVSEGDLVEIAGFLIPTPHPNKKESVNCNLTGIDNNDFHIPFASNPADQDVDGIVVEMIPQKRLPAWNLQALIDIQTHNRQVLVVGQLFYDNMHNVNTDPNSRSGDPKRFSLFEVHPITKFFVCKSDKSPCDPKQLDQWEPLEALSKQPESVPTSASASTPNANPNTNRARP